MDLKDYLAGWPDEQKAAFAESCGTTANHMRNVAYRCKPCGTALAVSIERESRKRVTRRELRPHDWWLHWPELVTKAFPAGDAPPVKARRLVAA